MNSILFYYQQISIDQHKLVVLNRLESFTCMYPIKEETLLYFFILFFFTEKKNKIKVGTSRPRFKQKSSCVTIYKCRVIDSF